MFRKHFSDEQLLALLDGEVDSGAARAAAEHLERCWSCRARRQEMESAAERLARAVDRIEYPGAEWLSEARQRLNAGIASAEAGAAPARARRFAGWRWVLIPAACAAAATTAFLTRHPKPPPPIERQALSQPRRTAAPRPQTPEVLQRTVPPVPVRAKLPRDLTPPPPGDPIAMEVEADYALHRVGACLGEQVEAAIAAEGKVAVRGVVETRARRAELEGALSRVPGLIVELDAAEDAAAPPGAMVPDAPGAVVRPVELPIRALLETRFGGEPDAARAVARFAARATELSQSAAAEAWALRRLDEKYPASRTGALRGASAWLLEDMLREHAAALRRISADLAALLEPVFGEPGEVAPGTAASRPEGLATLSEAAEEAGALARGLFAGGPLTVEPPDAAGRLLARLAELEWLAKKAEGAAHSALQQKAARAADRIPAK